MKTTQYSIFQRSMSYGLLIGLLLQSCSSPVIPKKISIEPPQQVSDYLLEGYSKDIAEIDQPISDRLVHTTSADLAITITQEPFKEENIHLKQQALKPTEHTQSTTRSLTPGPLLVKVAAALPSSTAKQANDRKGKGKVGGLQTRLVSQQKFLPDRQAINRQEISNVLKHALSSQVFQTKSGQEISFHQEAGAWKAKVEEKYGSLHRSLVLPVYFEGLSLPTSLKPSQIYVVEVSETHDKKSHVYVGSLGLPGGMRQSKTESDREEEQSREVILFCGNPGTGKSALCNSVFGESKFKSGLSSTGLTKSHQDYVFENKLYVDTPGLADVIMRKEAAEEIEEALKKNSNYKIIFVVTVESARIKPQDIETINVICEAINTPFEYGLIINKVTANIIKKVEADINAYLGFLRKRPSSTCIIKKDEAMEDAEDVFITNPENRKALVNFINNLKANKIPKESVHPMDTTDYKKQVEKLEQELQDLKKALIRAKFEGSIK